MSFKFYFSSSYIFCSWKSLVFNIFIVSLDVKTQHVFSLLLYSSVIPAQVPLLIFFLYSEYSLCFLPNWRFSNLCIPSSFSYFAQFPHISVLAANFVKFDLHSDENHATHFTIKITLTPVNLFFPQIWTFRCVLSFELSGKIWLFEINCLKT